MERTLKTLKALKGLLAALLCLAVFTAPTWAQTAGWEFPTNAAYSPSSGDNGKILSSESVPSGSITITLPSPSAVGAGWIMGFREANAHGIVLVPPVSTYILAGQKTMTTFAIPTQANYEYAAIQSDGTNFQLIYATETTANFNGVRLQPEGAAWIHLMATTYGSTLTDNGYTFDSNTAGGAVTFTLPSTGNLPNGWSIGLQARGGNSITIVPNGISGGTLVDPLGNTVASYVLSATNSTYAMLTFDGAAFKLKYASVYSALGTISANLGLFGPASGSPGPAAFRAIVPADLPPGVDTNVPNLQTGSTYSVATTDCGHTVAMGGNVQATLSVGAASGFPANCSIIIVNNDSAPGSGGHGKFMSISGLAFPLSFLYPGQSFAIKNVASNWTLFGGPGRYKSCTGFVIYSNFTVSSGDTSNDGLTASTPRKTANAALQQVMSDVDYSTSPNCGQTSITVQMLANDSSGIHYGPHDLVGSSSGDGIILDGGGFVLSSSTSGAPALSLFFGAMMYVQNITIEPSNTAAGIELQHGANLLTRLNVTFSNPGTVAGAMIQCEDSNTGVEIDNGLSIGGNVGNFIFAEQGCSVRAIGTITLIGNLGTSGAVVQASSGGHIDFSGATWNLNSFAVSGQTYNAIGGGIIVSQSGVPLSYWPGNVGGTTSCTTSGSSIGACGFSY